VKNVLLISAMSFLVSAPLASKAIAQHSPPAGYKGEYGLSVQDDLAIRQVIARLNHALDAADYKTYSSHFSSDAVFATTFGNAVGPEKIAAALEQSRPFITNKRHIPSNIVLNGRGSRVEIVMYLTVFERAASLTYLGSAVTTATAEKRNGKWLMVNYGTELDPATMAAMKAVTNSEKK
jgi:ketosteroid isomerase-like protein